MIRIKFKIIRIQNAGVGWFRLEVCIRIILILIRIHFYILGHTFHEAVFTIYFIFMMQTSRPLYGIYLFQFELFNEKSNIKKLPLGYHK